MHDLDGSGSWIVAVLVLLQCIGHESLILLEQCEAGAAFQKGDSRVRGFGTVVTFPVQFSTAACVIKPYVVVWSRSVRPAAWPAMCRKMQSK